MDKKDLKFYEAPATEVVELNVAASLLTGSNGSNAENVSSEEPEWD